MPDRLLSIVIPCFNHGEFLHEAVASVTDLRRDDVEIIVVDDGSTDERTGREMQALREAGVQVVRQENKGLAAARNAGISIARGRYILPLDADNRLLPAFIERGRAVLDENPKVGVVYGDAQYIGARSGRWAVGAFNPDWLMELNYIDACAMYRRPIWEQNGGYDGTMPAQGEEDWDFWLSTLERGWQFTYVPEILFEYRVVPDSMIARSHSFKPQIDAFIAAKHAALYRRRFIELAKEKSSVRSTSRNFLRLLRRNAKQIFSDGRST